MDLPKIHQDCGAIFKAELFDESVGDSLGRSNACRVFDALTEEHCDRQDSIGENFNRLIRQIADEWFDSYHPSGSLDYYFCNYTLLLYLLVERVDLIFSVVNPEDKSKIFRDFQETRFKTLRKVNKWANFFKHPKEFLFTHWPNYFLATEARPTINPGDVVIDYQFIKAHYYSESKPRPKILQNNNRVLVEVPDLVELTREFCAEMNVFFDFICRNDIVADFLRKKSTIEEIYATSDTTVTTTSTTTTTTTTTLPNPT